MLCRCRSLRSDRVKNSMRINILIINYTGIKLRFGNMKKILSVILLIMFGLSSKAEQISSVETNGNWVYVYNSKGQKYKTLSTSTVGKVVGYSSSFFVSENGSWIYLWDSDGKKYQTLSKSSVGDLTGVAGDTFTSRNGSWIYTWDKNGKKINTRSSN